MTTTVTKQGKRFKVTDLSKSEKPITEKHKGKSFDTLSQKDKDEMLKAALKKLGLLDENDKIK